MSETVKRAFDPMDETPNYSLPLYQANSSANLLYNFNDLATKVDTALKENADESSSNTSGVATLQTQMSTLNQTVTTNTTDISELKQDVSNNKASINNINSDLIEQNTLTKQWSNFYSAYYVNQFSVAKTFNPGDATTIATFKNAIAEPFMVNVTAVVQIANNTYQISGILPRLVPGPTSLKAFRYTANQEGNVVIDGDVMVKTDADGDDVLVNIYYEGADPVSSCTIEAVVAILPIKRSVNL